MKEKEIEKTIIQSQPIKISAPKAITSRPISFFIATDDSDPLTHKVSGETIVGIIGEVQAPIQRCKNPIIKNEPFTKSSPDTDKEDFLSIQNLSL